MTIIITTRTISIHHVSSACELLRWCPVFCCRLSLLHHHTATKLLLLSIADQLLDLGVLCGRGAQAPAALLGQEGEGPLDLWQGLEVLVGASWLGLEGVGRVLADVQTGLQQVGSGDHGGQG